MKAFRLFSLMTLALCLSLGFSCDSDTITPDEATLAFEEECSEPKACTYILVSIAMSLKDAEGNPVALDHYYSQNLRTGSIYDFRSNAETIALQRKDGNYPIISDAQITEVEGNGTPIKFVGKKNDKIVVNKTFRVGHDCCHVQLIEGETEIVID